MDRFRQDIFKLRDQLFDEARDGLINFDHPAYGMLRKTMNGYIRFAHRLSFLDILVTLSILNISDEDRFSFQGKWLRATDGLDEKTMERLTWFRSEMERLVRSKIRRSSIISLSMIALVAGVACAFNSCKSRAKRFLSLQPMYDGVNSAAMAEGRA